MVIEDVLPDLLSCPPPTSNVQESTVQKELEGGPFTKNARLGNGVSIDKMGSMSYSIFKMGGVYPPIDEPLKGGGCEWLRTRI